MSIRWRIEQAHVGEGVLARTLIEFEGFFVTFREYDGHVSVETSDVRHLDGMNVWETIYTEYERED